MSKPKKARPGPYAKEVARINQRAMQRYMERYYPEEVKFVSEVAGSLPRAQREAQDTAAAATEQAFAREQPALTAALTARGVDPSSGRGQMALTGMGVDKAVAAGQGVSAARTAATGQHFDNIKGLVGQGKGQEQAYMQRAGQVADQATNQAILDARASYASRAALQELAGTALGYGAGALKERFGGGGEQPSQGDGTPYGSYTSGLRNAGLPVQDWN